MSRKINSAGFIIGLLGSIMFSTKAIFVKLAFQNTHTDAVTLLSLRMLFSLPFYLVIALFFTVLLVPLKKHFTSCLDLIFHHFLLLFGILIIFCSQ